MLVADADGDRHRHDAAQHRGPECDDETLVRLAEDDELVAGLHAPRLQRPQQCRGAIPQLGKAEP